MLRRRSTFSASRIDHLYRDRHVQSRLRLRLHCGDLTDGQALTNLVLAVQPDEIYNLGADNLGAQRHVRFSYDQPVYTLQTIGVGTLKVLEGARQLMQSNPVRVYQASSSEMFGKVIEPPSRANSFQSAVTICLCESVRPLSNS